ncbi:PREDICTED: uncharacterized protein LOC109224230 [Nicotiana attenuata]|uniref:uncharacterized protein LOC109224230 n=1 Tax=Nicotiana attenuata TaxID=49451 RepID=UPI000904E905|nr:PREDICTED: uncharacterized protein LOC109224230 [Nicotiana attenuata]
MAHKNAQPDRSYNKNTNRGRGRSNRGRGGRGGRFNSRNYSTNSKTWQSNDQQQNQATNPASYLSHSTPNAPSQQWFPDTGATHHITPDLTLFYQIEDYKGPDQVHVGNGNGIPIHHTGNAILPSPFRLIRLNNILHVPAITKRLLSVQRFARDNNVFFAFHPYHFVMKDRASKTSLLSSKSDWGLYTLRSSSTSKSTSPSALYSIKPANKKQEQRTEQKLEKEHKRMQN